MIDLQGLRISQALHYLNLLQALRSRKEKNMALIPPIIKKIAITYGR